MRAGELFKLELLNQQFSESRVLETARKTKEAWPGFMNELPEGRKPISRYEAIQFLYLLSATEGAKDVALAIARMAEYMSPQAFDEIASDLESLDRIEISSRTGFINIYYSVFPSTAVLFPPQEEREVIIKPDTDRYLRKYYKRSEQLKKQILKVSGEAKSILQKELDECTAEIEGTKLAIDKWIAKYKLADSKKVDFITVLQSPFLKELARLIGNDADSGEEEQTFESKD